MTRCRIAIPALILLFLPLVPGCGDPGANVDPVPGVDGQAELLSAEGTIIEHETVSFQEIVQNSEAPVVVDFWASWCGPCRMQAPELEKLALRMPSVRILKVNVDEEPELAAHFQVSSIPALRIFRNGRAAGSLTGFHTAEEIQNAL